MIGLLLWMLMLHTASAETVAAAPVQQEVSAPVQQEVSAPVQQEVSASRDSVQEAGTQIHTGPVLMVTEYKVVEGDTIPGSSFELEMVIANLSETAAAYNVMATLTIENVSVSLQEDVTNQLYYHEIGPLQKVTARFPLEVYSYCTEENMILTMTMACCDAAVVHYDFQTMMTPSIEVKRTLQVGSLTVPQFVHRNSSMIISATLTNVEPVTLNHVRMHVITQYGEQTAEVGQLLTGESKTVDCIYRFPEQQTEDVQVYFTYESLYGHQYSTDRQAFDVVVYDPAVEDDFVSSDGEGVREILERLVQNAVIPGTDMQIPLPVFALIMVGCAGYGVVLYFALRRKRR